MTKYPKVESIPKREDIDFTIIAMLRQTQVTSLLISRPAPAQQSLSSPIFTRYWLVTWLVGASHSVALHWDKLQTSSIQFWKGGR